MNKKKVALACEKCNSRNYFVPKSSTERLIIKKYCRRCNEHTVHKEEK